MNIHYFEPEFNNSKLKKEDKSLITHKKMAENSAAKAIKIEQSKLNKSLLEKKENRLLTNDGREIFNENK